ncbi:MAG TPA: FAD-dependent oxidoreductase [Candidatus Latescibacteria bacterium]|mgnify:FL=1|nr:FAD-dependent oxidoreductase [Candidatus Latescibacterota bacterium]
MNAEVLVEAEHFDDLGGWTLDTGFVESMGSPYLIAHGLGTPVADATTTVRLPEPGAWRVWVRTFDWVARWDASGCPGRFEVLVDGEPVGVVFGTEGADWHWQDGGVIQIGKPDIRVSLHDLTGFNGRCDAICFSRDCTSPQPPLGCRPSVQAGREPGENASSRYDFVVVGGGYAGMCAAVSAARLGLSVALVQNRPVLGGNGSSEIRVPLRGLNPDETPYPLLGRTLKSLEYDAQPNASKASDTDDAAIERILRSEPNLTLLLNHYVASVEMEGNRIRAANAVCTRRPSSVRLEAHCFADCTGHGTLGALAGAEYAIAPRDLMGMTNIWSWEIAPEPQDFPNTPWALDLKPGDFPVPPEGKSNGTWCWESGFNLDPIRDLEAIRDWNLRAVFGAWSALKHGEEAQKYRNARLTFVSAPGGVRESRRLIGDFVLSSDDMLQRVEFEDGFVPVTWFLDRHVPDPNYSGPYRDNPFIATGIHEPGTDREARPRHGKPWWGIPYRCLYSRNIVNLFMAGRNISTTYWALGAVRVMRTCGLMGEVVGTAAAVCARHGCLPREVYKTYLEELKRLLGASST